MVGASNDLEPITGFSVLHEAIGVGHLDILQLLLPAASDRDVSALGFNPLTVGEDNGVCSPAEFAAERGDAKALRLLLEAGATPSDAALYRAIKHDQSAAAMVLLSSKRYDKSSLAAFEKYARGLNNRTNTHLLDEASRHA